MTEHILNFSIALDDDGIRKGIQEKAENIIIDNMKEDLLNNLFKSKYYHGNVIKKTDGKITLSKEAELSEISKIIIKETFIEFKDEIVDRTAKLLCESLRRSKAVKEATSEVLEKEV